MRAGAKINLMLHITGQRNDGYHLLQSLVMFAELGDDITLHPSTDFSLHLVGDFAHALSNNENLITKAAHALAKAMYILPHGSLSLNKNLPIGAGLGGGSSDAAATLTLLAKYWQCKMDLEPIARQLGSDVPACLQGRPLWMEGKGERITHVTIPFDIPALLVNPRQPLSTQEVYQSITPPYAQPQALPSIFPTLHDLIGFLYNTDNMLEAAAKQKMPAIDEIIRGIIRLPDCLLARMSGSGATCFGLFPTREACQHAQYELRDIHPDWWIQATMLKGNYGQEK